MLSEVIKKYVGWQGIGKIGLVISKENDGTRFRGENNEKKVDSSFDIDLPYAEMGKVCGMFPSLV